MPITTTSLFVVGSLTGMVQALPLLSESKVASHDVRRFLEKLEAASGSDVRASKKWLNKDIQTISLRTYLLNSKQMPEILSLKLVQLIMNFRLV